MNSNRPSEAPGEPYNRSEPAALSPASPKPIHFPAPTAIPLLELQMDVGHNQVERHMADPAMHNTEVRPDFWRDPNEPQAEGHASPYSTGGEVAESETALALSQEQEDTIPQHPQAVEEGEADTADTGSKDSATNDTAESQHIQLSNHASHQANAQLEVQAPVEPEAANFADASASSHPSAPTSGQAPTARTPEPAVNADDFATHLGEVHSRLPASDLSAVNGNVDVDSLLATLQGRSSVTATPATNGGDPYTPSLAQDEPAPPGAEGSPITAAGLTAPPSGLPARPPPQEQPLIHPNYVHSQHIRDYHPHAAHPAFQPQQAVGTGGKAGSQGTAADPTLRSHVPSVFSPTSAVGQPASINGIDTASTASTAPTNNSAAAASGYTSSFVASAGSPTTSTQQFYQQPLPGAGSAYGQQHGSSPTSAIPNDTSIAATLQQNQTPYTPAQAYSASLGVSNTPIESRRESKLAAGEIPSPEDRPWNAEVQAKYDRFIESERAYVSEGRWEQFPSGSRLFVGNLSSEKVTKRDIFHVFHPYGELAQISIKQAYGFVQFLRTEDCMHALSKQQGVKIREKKVHLEVSKPQKNKIQAQQQHQQRRSRSPDYGRGKPDLDRYTGGRGGGGRSQPGGGYGRQGAYRSPSPPRYGGRGYDDRGYRARSPDYGRGRYRSPSPRNRDDDDLPLPRRQPKDVPDVQIIVLDNLERDFINWVEKAFANRGVSVDVLLLSPRLDEQAVIKRQIVEGVTAVSKLTKQNQDTARIGLQIFKRTAGINSVTFDEYANLDPNLCVELVLRAKNSYSQQPAPTPAYGGGGAGYGAPQYGAPQPPPQQQYGGYGGPMQYAQPAPGYPPQPPYAQARPPQPQPPTPTGAPPNLQNLIGSLDPNSLQSLLSMMNQQGQSPATPQTASSYGAPGAQYGQQQQQAMVALQQNPALAGALHQQQQQQQQGGQPAQGGGGGQGGNVNMQDILARLGTYGR
ncbi:hypothetical protein B0A50_05996 [Salinomyces thailandicus]|uniref:RRM domain-containing protein n=1 Tax=Salinomyces thailandicus TaxID=706561 RepID=A0A4U0TQV4_9PEZI|nr:hypothetical protein B0A50_05996 [Salinomyces thailandica]